MDGEAARPGALPLAMPPMAPPIARGANDPVSYWAERINSAWRVSLDGFFECGRLLVAAKKALLETPPPDGGHGKWLELIGSRQAEGKIPFGPRVAQKLMRVAEDTFLTETSHETFLPADYNTLYLLYQLRHRFPDRFQELLDQGQITPALQRNDISKILRLERVATDEQRILNLVPRPGKYRTLVIDPAWEYDWLSIAGRAKPGYAMQTLDQLRDLNVAAWADDDEGCHLYCWVTNNFMAEACKLVARWGFQHRTLLTWIKPPPFGLGSYYRNSTEHVLFATLGETTTRPAAASIPTHFEAPRGEHSEKPERFYEIVRAASYPPYGEANQREARPDFENLFVEAEAAA
jgi:N6-adenosine-specific RNA methylase IME4